jgi:hypothetical protein
MKKIALVIAITAALAACTEKPTVQTEPSIPYDLTQNGDTSVITVLDGDSREVPFVFSDSDLKSTGMSYEKAAEACRASILEARAWPLYPKSFRYNGPSRIVIEGGKIQIIVEGALEGEPTKFIMKAKLDGTVEGERVM